MKYPRSFSYTGPCGLIFWEAHELYPHRPPQKVQATLCGVDVEAKIVDLCSVVQISQRYENTRSVPVQAEYVFPLDSNAAISAFESETNGKITKGIVKEKQEAKEIYQDAISQGQSAQLLEQSRADVFQMSLGNIPPHSTTIIRISYVADLKVQGDAVCFFLPTFVAPRYQPSTEINPIPHNPSTRKRVGDGLYVNLVAAMASDIVSIVSENPEIKIITTLPTPGQRRVQTVQLAEGAMSLSKDLFIKVRTVKPHQPRVLVEKSPQGTYAALVSLVPMIELDCSTREFVFIVDRSGSMRGTKMEQARKALQLFLRSLPEDCYLSIVGFGSRQEFLWNNGSQKYSAQTLAKASDHVAKMQANLGGTELMDPLERVLSKPPIRGYDRQLFVLTDGQVSNTDAVVNLVKKHTRTTATRVFGLGLGHGASHALVDGIARVGRGTAEYCVGDSGLDAKVIGQLKTAIQPALNDVTIDWIGITQDETPIAVPDSPPPPFEDDDDVMDVDDNEAINHCDNHPDGQAVHHHIICDGSEVTPIVGRRYHKTGEDFDLCELEFRKLLHTQKQAFEVIPRPGDVPMPYIKFVENYKQAKQNSSVPKPRSLLDAFAPATSIVGSLLGFTSTKPKPLNPALAQGYACAPFTPPPVLSGERHLNFCLLEPNHSPPTSVRITAKSPVGDIDVVLPVGVADTVEGTLVHSLAARALIEDLTDGTSWLHKAPPAPSALAPSPTQAKSEIIRLGTKYGLVSQHTSYVAVQADNEVWRAEAVRVREREQQLHFRATAALPPNFRCHRGRVRSAQVVPCGNSAPMRKCAALRPTSSSMSNRSVRGGGGGMMDMMSKSSSKKKKSKKDSSAVACLMDDDEDDSMDCFMESMDAMAPQRMKGASFAFAPSPSLQQQQQLLQSAAKQPKPSTPSAPKISNAEKLQQVIQGQEFSGEFNAAQIAQITNVTLPNMTQAATALTQTTKGLDVDLALKVISTAVAISFLCETLSHLRVEWELIEAKAMRWLVKTMATLVEKGKEENFVKDAILTIGKTLVLQAAIV